MGYPTSSHDFQLAESVPETTVDEPCCCPRCLRQLPTTLRVVLLIVAGAMALLIVLLPLGLAALVSCGPAWFRSGPGLEGAIFSAALAGFLAAVILAACYEHAKPRS